MRYKYHLYNVILTFTLLVLASSSGMVKIAKPSLRSFSILRPSLLRELFWGAERKRQMRRFRLSILMQGPRIAFKREQKHDSLISFLRCRTRYQFVVTSFSPVGKPLTCIGRSRNTSTLFHLLPLGVPTRHPLTPKGEARRAALEVMVKEMNESQRHFEFDGRTLMYLCTRQIPRISRCKKRQDKKTNSTKILLTSLVTSHSASTVYLPLGTLSGGSGFSICCREKFIFCSVQRL